MYLIYIFGQGSANLHLKQEFCIHHHTSNSLIINTIKFYLFTRHLFTQKHSPEPLKLRFQRSALVLYERYASRFSVEKHACPPTLLFDLLDVARVIPTVCA